MRSSGLNPNQYSRSSLTEDSLNFRFFMTFFISTDNSQIVFAILKRVDVHKAFLKEYLNQTPKQFTMFWVKKIFTGEGEEPKSFATEKEMIDFIAGNKGAIGYISSAPNGKVKKITIK